ncbi:hypothetical protein [Micromonospora sp. NPDC023956]|uniref:hypothetical protein n=1 Tax=Micromonospora sp. NPDC023956 TaxID=3155722 RepID=UPI0033F7CA5A
MSTRPAQRTLTGAVVDTAPEVVLGVDRAGRRKVSIRPEWRDALPFLDADLVDELARDLQAAAEYLRSGWPE